MEHLLSGTELNSILKVKDRRIRASDLLQSIDLAFDRTLLHLSVIAILTASMS